MFEFLAFLIDGLGLPPEDLDEFEAEWGVSGCRRRLFVRGRAWRHGREYGAGCTLRIV